ncbi:MAG: XTP/dITP diphosphatase [Planctomycetota bacterium]
MKIEKVFLATGNPKKRREIEAIVQPLGVRVTTEEEVGGVGEVVEDGDTFEANAIKKARASARRTGIPSLADDSGLEVDALRGAPGVRSARYAGEGATDADNNRKLLDALKDVPDDKRTAAFRCVIAFALPAGKVDARIAFTAEGTCKGRILRASRGCNGFGYDPLFYYEPLGKTFAELPMDEKAKVSHRGKALAEFAERFQELLKRNRRER